MKSIKYTLIFSIIAVSVTGSLFGTKTVRAEDGQSSPYPLISNAPGTLKAKLQAGYENHIQNARNNQDYRNSVLQNKTHRSGDDGDQETDDDNATSTASTTPRHLFPGKGPEMMKEIMKEHEEHRKETRRDLFAFEKMHIVEQLRHSLDNLRQIRTRILDRIVKAEGSGRNMTQARTLLLVADSKITFADQAITNLANFGPTGTSTATSTATTTIDLGKPRQLAMTAINAVKDAQRALNEVVRAIAHNMGLRLGDDGDDDGHHGTSTGTSTATSTHH